MQQLASLNHDGVSHIMLGATAYEHKIFVGPFARKFPEAKVWAVPDQWSFPLNLPAAAYGIDSQGTGGGELVDTAPGSTAYASGALPRRGSNVHPRRLLRQLQHSHAPAARETSGALALTRAACWLRAAPDLTAEFEVKLLHPAKRLGLGYAANEAALLHKETKTLALTDALVNVPATPPEIYDPSNLLAVGDNGRDVHPSLARTPD